MRIVILGNSGSGKSTLARWLAATSGAALLDLDTVAWQPGNIAVPQAPDVAAAQVRDFCAVNAKWVVEGCYAALVAATFAQSPRLVFLNPGEARCVANCLARPWEPHKYRSKQEQDERLDFLLSWVRQYYSRSGDMSLAGHRACFDAYDGPKIELSEQATLDPPDRELLGWLG